MTDQKIPQPTSDVNYPYLMEEETSFIDILAVIVKKKGLILLITALFTFLTICYFYLATPIYRAKISFLPPSQEIYLSSIDPNILFKPIDKDIEGEKRSSKDSEDASNILKNLNSDKFLYRQFLTRVQSFSQQKEVLLKKNIAENFFGNTADLENADRRFIDLHNSISLETAGLLKPSKDSIPLDKPVDLTMEGPNPIAMADFLNALSISAKEAIINETQFALQTLVDNRLKMALNHKKLILFKADKDRSKMILDFSNSLKIAQKLGVKKNNFYILKNDLKLQIKNGENKDQKSSNEDQLNFETGLIPIWYLFGEDALKEELRILNSRTLDDNYIEELVDLEAQIKQLQSFKANTLVPNVTLIEQPSIPPTKPINLKAEKAFPTGIGLGLLFGIFAAYLSHSMEKLRKQKDLNQQSSQ